MMDEIRGDDPIESKAITIEEMHGPGRAPVMMTAFEEEDNKTLDIAGYRGRYVIFALIDGGVQEASHDPRKIDHHIVSGEILDFMLEVKKGWETHGREGIDWTELTHGEVYDRDHFIATVF